MCLYHTTWNCFHHVLGVEETGVSGENHRRFPSQWQFFPCPGQDSSPGRPLAFSPNALDHPANSGDPMYGIL